MAPKLPGSPIAQNNSNPDVGASGSQGDILGTGTHKIGNDVLKMSSSLKEPRRAGQGYFRF